MSLLKNKLKYLVDVSLKRKLHTKWFMIANIILALIIVAVINIDSVIRFFGGDFDEAVSVYVIDETGVSFERLKEQIESLEFSVTGEEETGFDVKLYDKDLDSAKKELEEDEDATIITLASDDTSVLSATLISESYIDTLDYQVLYQAIQNTKTMLAMDASSVSEEELNQIYAPIEIERIILDETKKSENESMETVMSTVFPVVILPFFMLTIFLVQMIGAEVNDEKTTRGMEIIIQR